MDRRRVPLLVVPPLFLGLYVLYPYFMPYYALSIAPAVILLVLLGIDALARAMHAGAGATGSGRAVAGKKGSAG